MAINAGDIKLVASQVMDDVDEGGGAPTSTNIVDGTSNSIFNDISELDRAIGRVNLRKVFATVQTANVDGYFGTNVIVADPPDDPNVSVSLFSTRDTFDTRDAAQTRIESYLAQGPTYPGQLFGDHIAGMATVSLIQREEVELPAYGDTIVLRKNINLSNDTQQFVRITKVESTVRTFTDDKGDFKRRVVTITIGDILRADYPGYEANRYDTKLDNKAVVFETIIADAARYYGVVALVEDAAIGDFTVNGDSIFSQIVPSTRIEVPIADARMNQQSSAFVAAGVPMTISLTSIFSTTQALFIGGSILPGSLSIVRSGITVIDKGGVLMNDAAQVGLIDYANGVATLTTNVFGSGSGTHSITYTPSGLPTIVSQSIGVPVSQQAQRLSWVVSLSPIPTKASLQVSYRVQSKWYVLTEDGSGAIRGSDSSFGAGTLNYSTGTVSVTLGALPDVDSQIIFTWVSSTISRNIASVPAEGPALSPAFGKTLKIADSIKPGTINISWNDGTARSAADSGGVLTGYATGSVNYGDGSIEFRPTTLPPDGTNIVLTTTDAVQHIEHMTFDDGGANWEGTTGGVVKARSFELGVVGSYIKNNGPIQGNSENRNWYRIFDDGAGLLKLANRSTNSTVGTIDYTTGDFTLVKAFSGFLVELPTYQTNTVIENLPGSGGGLILSHSVSTINQVGYALSPITLSLLNEGTGVPGGYIPPWAWWTFSTAGGAAEMRWAGGDGSGATYNFTFDEIFMESSAGAVQGFNIGSDRYLYSSAASAFMVNPSPTTGVGTSVGGQALVGGRKGVLLTTWTAGATSAPTNVYGATAPAVTGADSVMLVESVTFRTSISPLFSGGFTIAGTFADGTDFSATPDINGIIKTATSSAAGVVGKVDYNSGVVTLRFGKLDGDEGDDGVLNVEYLEIDDVTTMTMLGVQADTLRYNAVGFSYIPLDADVIGLDPVRLPNDGRVPIFRQGSVAVVGNTATVGPATVANGQTINCSRVRLSRVRVIGNDGAVINTGYTEDLEAGTVTFVDVTGYSQPVTVEHRIEDMGLVSDAQISGQLTFTRALTHNYPAEGSYISSALIAGDMHARVSNSFDQATWSNVWSDDLIGSSAGGTFNTISNPLVVQNHGALTERWAMVFTNTTSFNIVGEHVGQIGSGNTGTNCAPNNPATGTPYFTIPSAGWGTGWAAGNAFRFNTVGAEFPVWVIRTILQGPATVDDDEFTLLIRGDVDAP